MKEDLQVDGRIKADAFFPEGDIETLKEKLAYYKKKFIEAISRRAEDENEMEKLKEIVTAPPANMVVLNAILHHAKIEFHAARDKYALFSDEADNPESCPHCHEKILVHHDGALTILDTELPPAEKEELRAVIVIARDRLDAANVLRIRASQVRREGANHNQQIADAKARLDFMEGHPAPFLVPWPETVMAIVHMIEGAIKVAQAKIDTNPGGQIQSNQGQERTSQNEQ